MNPIVAIKLRDDLEDKFFPTKSTIGSVGYDIRSRVTCSLNNYMVRCIPTGIHLELPSGWEAQVRPRSGLSSKGIIVVPGTIDSDYRGEIKVLAYSLLRGDIQFGDRIAQLVFMPAHNALLREVMFLNPTDRGTNGLGSTGLK